MITDDVHTMLFEAACFNGTNIRLSSKKVGLRTEASGKFEKGLDPENAKAAIDRACQLIEELGAGEVVDGIVDVYAGAKEPEFPFLPRFGFRLFLPKRMDRVEYCGIGPVESYLDKRRAGWHGVFDTTVKALHEDYIRPQENGSHHDCDYVTVYGDQVSLTAAGRETFAFNASVYTQEELTNKAHNYELEESPYTVLCVDYRQSGIGSNSCGPNLLPKYRLEEEQFAFHVKLLPGMAGLQG